jgi:hypothetical protein
MKVLVLDESIVLTSKPKMMILVLPLGYCVTIGNYNDFKKKDDSIAITYGLIMMVFVLA